MPEYKPIETDLSVVYPPGRQLSAKVRSVVDFLAERFTGEPECDRWRTDRAPNTLAPYQHS
jgi:hypothetical protein